MIAPGNVYVPSSQWKKRYGWIDNPDAFEQIAKDVNDGKGIGQVLDMESGEILFDWVLGERTETAASVEVIV